MLFQTSSLKSTINKLFIVYSSNSNFVFVNFSSFPGSRLGQKCARLYIHNYIYLWGEELEHPPTKTYYNSKLNEYERYSPTATFLTKTFMFSHNLIY